MIREQVIFKFRHETGINVYECDLDLLFPDEDLSQKTPIQMTTEEFNAVEDFEDFEDMHNSVKAPLCIYEDGAIDDGHHRYMLLKSLGIKKCLVYFVDFV